MARKEKKYHFIYKTTNQINGKFYVGMHSTHNLNDGYLGSGTRLRRSIRRNGAENFKVEYLEFFDNRVDLISRERELVNEDLLKDPMCMNLQPGGGGGLSSDEHKQKFQRAGALAAFKSKKNIQRKQWLWENDKKWADRTRKNMSDSLKGLQAFLGKTHSEETKKKIGEASSLNQKGQLNSQFGTCWITNGIENKKINKTDLIPIGWKIGRILK